MRASITAMYSTLLLVASMRKIPEHRKSCLDWPQRIHVAVEGPGLPQLPSFVKMWRDMDDERESWWREYVVI